MFLDSGICKEFIHLIFSTINAPGFSMKSTQVFVHEFLGLNGIPPKLLVDLWDLVG